MGCKNTKASDSSAADVDLSSEDQAAIRRLSWASEAHNDAGDDGRDITTGNNDTGRSKFGMVARRDSIRINKSAIEILRKDLIKKVYLVTPNIPEAEVLANMKINNKEDMILAANRLINYGAKNVLIKGGHLNSKKVIDIFLNKTDFKIFSSTRYKTKHTHGTGCTLSSAITTFLSCGKTIKKACDFGIKYVNSAILTNPNYGKGNGPINHLNSMEIKKRFK